MPTETRRGPEKRKQDTHALLKYCRLGIPRAERALQS